MSVIDKCYSVNDLFLFVVDELNRAGIDVVIHEWCVTLADKDNPDLKQSLSGISILSYSGIGSLLSSGFRLAEERGIAVCRKHL